MRLVSLSLQLQVTGKLKPPKREVASLAITVHEEFSFKLKRLTHGHFSALFIKEKSIIFRLPFFFSPISLFWPFYCPR